MAKHPVPKRKTSKSRTSSRYSAFQFKARTNIEAAIKLVACSNCGSQKRAHHVCDTCGFYRGKQMLDKNKEMDKITKIKA